MEQSDENLEEKVIQATISKLESANPKEFTNYSASKCDSGYELKDGEYTYRVGEPCSETNLGVLCVLKGSDEVLRHGVCAHIYYEIQERVGLFRLKKFNEEERECKEKESENKKAYQKEFLDKKKSK